MIPKINWIPENLVLENEHVCLRPLETRDIEPLIEAGQEEIIWTYMPARATDKEQYREELHKSLQAKQNGEQFPFVVIDKRNNRLIGSTRFLRLSQEHLNLEIGWTWYLPAYWSKGFNETCKLLLLKYCFEELKVIRVQITANVKNNRSRKAIERIGGKYEGILRNSAIRFGEKRSAAYYSIIDEEWPAVEQNLQRLIKERKQVVY